MKKLLIILFIFPAFANAQIINTIAGSLTLGYSFGGDGGPATAASFYDPVYVVKDASGNLYVSDFYNKKVRKITPSGIVSTFAGCSACSLGDGGPATNAAFASCEGLAFDANGNLYIADNEGYRVRKINTSGIITTVAGNGLPAHTGDGGPATAASLHTPRGIAIDATGNLYIADFWNFCVRKVDTNGIITTIAGNGTSGFTGDGGPATAATMEPIGIAIDKAGNIFISDGPHSVIRMVNAAGIISTIEGNGTGGYSGDGGPATAAQTNGQNHISFDKDGNLYLADLSNNCIRKIDTFGIISTVAGIPASSGYSGDGGPATAALFHSPSAVLPDSLGGIYIVDYQNQCIRYICVSGNPSVHTTASPGDTISGGTTVTFTAAYTNGGAYPNFQWTKNGINVGYNADTYIDNTLVNGDIIKCILTSNSQCTTNPIDTSNKIVIYTPSLNVKTPESTFASIYPNPANSLLTITYTEKINTVNISNLLGQTVYTHIYNSEQVQINVAALSPGMYLVRINNTEVTKFVKK